MHVIGEASCEITIPFQYADGVRSRVEYYSSQEPSELLKQTALDLAKYVRAKRQMMTHVGRKIVVTSVFYKGWRKIYVTEPASVM